MYKSFFDGLKKDKPLEQKIDLENTMCCGIPLKNDTNYMCCSKCGIIKPLIINDVVGISTAVYEPRIIKQIYSRKVHFKKIILQLQGREIFHNKEFPKIKQYLDDHKIKDYSTQNIKNVLFNLRLTGYYLHIQLIRKHLGCEMIIMSQPLMDRLIRLFIQVEEQLTGNNLPSYHFILRQLLDFLGDNRFNHLLKKLKNEKKLQEKWSAVNLV